MLQAFAPAALSSQNSAPLPSAGALTLWETQVKGHPLLIDILPDPAEKSLISRGDSTSASLYCPYHTVLKASILYVCLQHSEDRGLSWCPHI